MANMHAMRVVLVKALIVTTLAGCGGVPKASCSSGKDPYIPFGPRDIRNDIRHTGIIASQTVLVPGVAFETRQNELLRLADASGRDFNMLIGPFPRLGPPARVRVRNADVTAVEEAGFAMMIGKQPNAIVRTVRTYSSGTYYITWINGDDVYVFCENSSTGKPVKVLPDTGTAYPPAELTTGQWALIRGGATIAVSKYFEPGHADAGVSGLNPQETEFLTYARSRGLAAGLFCQGEYFLGRYANGIPAEDLAGK